MSRQVMRQFKATPEAVREARGFLQTVMGARVDPETTGDLTVALSELATNAVRHARTPFDVVVETGGYVRIEVWDGSTHAPVSKPSSDEGGRGLNIVDQLCDRWGVHIGSERKCVWCERDLPDRGAAPSHGEPVWPARFGRVAGQLEVEVSLMAVIALRGEVDTAALDDLQSAVEPHLAPGQTVVLDLSDVTFADSTLLRVLAQARGKANEASGALLVRNPSDQVRKLLALGDLDDIVHTEVDRQNEQQP